MRILNILGAAALGGALFVPQAQAADLETYPAPTSTGQVVPLHQSAGFDWNRFYAGVYGVAQKDAPGWRQGLGIEAGVNTQYDMYVLGAEVAVHGLTQQGNNGGTYGQVLTRGGALVTDNLLAYGAVGYGMDLGGGTSNQNLLVGGGLEMAVSDNVSLKGQYLYGMPLTAGSTQVNQVTFGANFHF